MKVDLNDVNKTIFQNMKELWIYVYDNCILKNETIKNGMNVHEYSIGFVKDENFHIFDK